MGDNAERNETGRAYELQGLAKIMRLNTLSILGLLLVGLASTGSRALAIYNDPAGDYIANPDNASNGVTFDSGTGTFKDNLGNAIIAPDIKSISGIYDSGISSYVFTIDFYNNLITLPSTGYGTVDTTVAGYMDFVIGDNTPSGLSLINQYGQAKFAQGPYNPMPTSDYYINLGASTSVNPGTNSFHVQNTSTNVPSAQLGTLALTNDHTYTITVPLGALGLSDQPNKLQYSFLAFSDVYTSADFGPNQGSPYVVGVPEASSLTLIGIGGAGLALGYWRRRRAA